MILSIKFEEQRKSYITCNIIIMTRITNRNIPCVHSCLWNNKSRGTGPHSSLRHADNIKHFSGLSLTRNQREALSLREGGGKNLWDTLAEIKITILITEFKDGQIWKIWPSHLVYHFTIPSKIYCYKFQFSNFFENTILQDFWCHKTVYQVKLTC